MPREFIDISVAPEAGIASDPTMMLPRIDCRSHAEAAPQVAAIFPGLTPGDLPGGEGWAVETLTVSTHNGTHLDAPYHHPSTMDGGRPTATIGEVPLDWCLRPGVKLDFRHLPDGHVVRPEEMEAEPARVGHELRPLDIVVVATSAGARHGKDDYLSSGCGMERGATLFLLARGVRVTDTDAWSWNAPFALTAEPWAETRDPSIVWEGHRASMVHGYCHMEKPSNLDALPATGFEISCVPVEIRRAAAGFTRAVAILEDAEGSSEPSCTGAPSGSSRRSAMTACWTSPPPPAERRTSPTCSR